MAERILTVDDDPVQRRRLETLVANLGYDPVVVATGDAALAVLADPDQAEIDCIVLDLVMPDLDGLGVLARIRRAGIAVPVIIQTAESGVDNVPSAINAGAADFVIKPVGIERLQVALRNALAHRTLIRELSRARRGGAPTLKDIAVHSAPMRAVLRTAEKAAASILPVLITGEPGVGKTFIARAIHESGERRTKPFVVVDCATMPHALACALLFGHEKGAVPGTVLRRSGKLVEAAGGTLLLRDVDALPPATQIKLFRAIETGEVEPICAHRPVPIDVRLISTSSRDLITDTNDGRFDEDLFHRLQTFQVAVPPLRERREEIPDLIRRFLLRFADDEGGCAPLVSAETLDKLTGFAWPGNIRQLEKAVSRAVALADGDPLHVGDFPQCGKSVAIPHGIAKDANESADDRAGLRTAKIVSILAHAHTGAPMTSLPLLAEDGQIRSLAEIEADVIRFAVNHYRRRISEVARKLGIGRATLYRKLDTLGMALSNANDSSSVSIG